MSRFACPKCKRGFPPQWSPEKRERIATEPDNLRALAGQLAEALAVYGCECPKCKDALDAAKKAGLIK